MTVFDTEDDDDVAGIGTDDEAEVVDAGGESTSTGS